MLTSVRTLRHRSIFSMATMRWGKEQRAKDGSLSIVTMDEALDAVAQAIVRGEKKTSEEMGSDSCLDSEKLPQFW